MKPYVNKWKFIIHPVLKVLGDNQVSKSSIRQHAKKDIALDIYDHYHGIMHLEMSDYWNKSIIINFD